MTQPEVLAVFGPTASGKTAVAEALADRLGTGVVSADAMQVYRGLPILTNQPARATRLVAVCGLDEEMSVASYAALAHREVDALVAECGAAVVSGGTGLYLRAALADLDVPPAVAPEARARIAAEVDADRDAAHGRLEGIDPGAATAVHPHDRKRLIRALELAETGTSLVVGRDRLWSTETRRPDRGPGSAGRCRGARAAHPRADRGDVHPRRCRRGAVGPHSRRVPTAAKTLGLDEIARLGPDALEPIVARTRRYAAYQRKWMRRIPGVVLVDGNRPPDVVADEILTRTDG